VRRGIDTLVALWLLAAAPRAHALPPVDRPLGRTPTEEDKREGLDLLHAVPWLAALDSGWSLVLTFGWSAVAGLRSAPLDKALGGLVAARLLYGTSWSVLVTGEALVAYHLGGEAWGWLGEAWYVTDRTIALDVPAGCPNVGGGACGLGLGSAWSELRARIASTPLWLSVGGGWVVGRHGRDAERTVAESTWVLSPLTAQAAVGEPPGHGFGARLGGGVFFGVHNAHVHPRGAAADERLDVPVTEMVPLDAGIGAGPRIELWASLPGGVALELDVMLAPLLGASHQGAEPAIAPLDARPDGTLMSWRALSLGASVPVDASGTRLLLGYWVSELSTRPWLDVGHRAVTLRWQVPLRR
jgi:hypothetical protein